ncbi:hypothetical protein A3F28_03860 [Candidatus Uhrbacteria bacterium RIFCSPHIGHO2_12_FULL_57_11]|uniref:Nucleotide exchange factor GrpE n=2 Tax=Candidatus Uhriibacteriota TaxID=1752732 RepID=A0A1F7ULP8_9BACT|nr:MAG: hypothetical protein A3D72_00035 [Candidatus Uhrbacteria bacterium RIFCSPHIGHO2_02_FULL_57_19]OGL78664.1 MAG: hypothetical protein A3F28_03860 [Candidatus Uhrbacteria bacterium RIFCSPHIGHO2_12_FULL_57_11]
MERKPRPEMADITLPKYGDVKAGITVEDEAGEERRAGIEVGEPVKAEEAKGEKEEVPDLREKVQELEQRAAERVSELQKELDEKLEQTEGWGGEDEPDYRKEIRRQAEFVGRYVDQLSKRQEFALTTVVDSFNEAFSALKRKIARVKEFERLPEEQKTVLEKGRLAAITTGALTAKGFPDFASMGKGIKARSFEALAKDEIER